MSCTEVRFGNVSLHRLQTPQSQVFALAEVAVQVFQENPTAFLTVIKRGRYQKAHSQDPQLLALVVKLGIQLESTAATAGVALVTTDTVKTLLLDKHKRALLMPFRIALLKLNSQEAAQHMSERQHEQALVIAMEAVKEGQDLFKPQPDLRLFPLFLLAAQANLGLRRCKRSEELLALASWLLHSEPSSVTPLMRAQLSRLFGQLYSLLGRNEEALHSFAQDTYHCSLAYGPLDVRTSLAYYNLAKVFEGMDEADKTLACCDQVVSIWSAALSSTMSSQAGSNSQTAKAAVAETLPLSDAQLHEASQMLTDILQIRAKWARESHKGVGELACVMTLLFLCLNDVSTAKQHFQDAQRVLSQQPATNKCDALMGVAQAGLQAVAGH